MKKSDLKRIIREEIQKLNEIEYMVPMGWPDGLDCGFCYEQGCACNLKTGCSNVGGQMPTPHENCGNPDGFVEHEYGQATGAGDMWLDGPLPDNNPKPKPIDFKVKDPNFGGGNTDPNPDDFSGGVGHPGGPGRSGKTRLREQADWDGNCNTLLAAYTNSPVGLEGLCSKCDTAGSVENNQVPSPCDCNVMSQGQMKPLKDFCRDKFPQLGIGGANSQWGIGSDDIPVDDPLDASTSTNLATAIPMEPSREPKLPDAKPDDGKLPFSILKRAGIKPKPRAPRKPRRR